MTTEMTNSKFLKETHLQSFQTLYLPHPLTHRSKPALTQPVTTSAILDSVSERDLCLKRAGEAQSLWEYEGEIMLAQAIYENTAALRRDQIAQQKRRCKKYQRSKPSEQKRQVHALQVSEQRIQTL